MFEVKEIPSKFIRDFLDTPSLRNKLCKDVTSLYCTSDKYCHQPFEIKEIQIGVESSYGKLFEACWEGECRYVAKWMPRNENPFPEVMKEATIQNDVSKIGLAPRVYQLLFCTRGSLLIMERMEKTVTEALKEQELSSVKHMIIKEVFNCIDKLHELGYSREDSHLNNFMLDYDGTVKIIDFGKILPYSNYNKMAEYETIKDYITDTSGEYEHLKILEPYINERIEEKRKTIIEESKYDYNSWTNKWVDADNVNDVYNRFKKINKKISDLQSEIINDSYLDIPPSEEETKRKEELLIQYNNESLELFNIIKNTIRTNTVGHIMTDEEIKEWNETWENEHYYASYNDILEEFINSFE